MVSWIWSHCIKIDKNSVKCKLCHRVLAISGGTKGITTHLLKIHQLCDTSKPLKRTETSRDEVSSEISSPLPKRQKTMTDYYQYSTLEETLARLSAESGLSIRQISKTNYIRRSLQRDFPKRVIPKNQTGIMKLIMKYYDIAKKDTKERIQMLKEEGTKFSSTLDEWTSLKNVRYLNVNLHYNCDGSTTSINLGLLSISGCCPAEKIIEMVYFSILN